MPIANTPTETTLDLGRAGLKACDGEHANDCVEIPREPTWLYEHQGQRVRVPLPIEAHPRRVMLLAFSAWLLALGVFGLLPAAYLGELYNPRHGPDSWSTFALAGLMTLFFTPCGLVCIAFALVGFADVLRRGPAVVLNAHGLRDERTRVDVAWKDIASIIVLRHGENRHVAGLLLRLRRPAPRSSWTHLFRYGTPLLPSALPKHKAHVTLWLLTPSKHVLRHAAEALALRHGASTFDIMSFLRPGFAWRVRLRKPARRPRSAHS